MVTTNFRKHEIIGIILIFVAASWLGFGLYATLLAANHLVAQIPLIYGYDLLIFPMFYGVGAVLMALGHIELREALPGKNRQ